MRAGEAALEVDQSGALLEGRIGDVRHMLEVSAKALVAKEPEWSRNSVLLQKADKLRSFSDRSRSAVSV
jgi:hypothetical protein